MADEPILSPGRPAATNSDEIATQSLPASGLVGEVLGPYRLLQRIGEGGMGEVWLAEQSTPICRQVALKVIKAGMDSKQIVARFEAERQALALMSHPAIAKVFEAGETPRGLPYFAMEYVKGEPITSYCDRQRLTTCERLELFMQVCDGVQHAHQKGVIHRDLKPSNVLVAIQDDRPVPKIIDFGVAKAISRRLTERTMFTELGALIGTPEYMSPEQAEMTGLDIDTRTDVYALGIILYELLVGALPFDPTNLRKAGFDEIRRRIREVDPPRPSTRVGTMGEASAESARNRKSEPAKLVGQLKGDLDWITMKSLEKDRTRRYGSPSELAADIGRHLRNEPVLAGAPGAAYRAKKFVRRHRFGVAAAAMGMAGLLGFAATTTVQARRIAKERDRANQESEVSKRASEFMTDLFQVSDPSEARDNTVTAREILDRGASKIDTELKDSPVIQAQLMHTMGLVYRSLGLYEQAETQLRNASEVRLKLLGPDHPDTLRSQQWWGWVLNEHGRHAEADRMLRAVLERQRRVLEPKNPDIATSLVGLGNAQAELGHPKDAEALYREALDIRRQALGPDHRDTLSAMGSLAWALGEMGQVDEAISLQREALEANRRVFGPDHPNSITSMSQLAQLDWHAKRYAEAEKLALESIEIGRRVLGPGHPTVSGTMGTLASVFSAEGRPQEAEALDRQMVDLSSRFRGSDHRETLAAMGNLASDLLDLRRYEEAQQVLVQVLEAQRRKFGSHNADVARTLYNLACATAEGGNRAKAFDWLNQAVEAGYAKPDEIRNDSQLSALHGDKRFERLVAAVTKNVRQ